MAQVDTSPQQNLLALTFRGDVQAVQDFLSTHEELTLSDRLDSDGSTALHAAAHVGHLRLLQYLIESGGDVNAKDVQERTPMHIAAEEGHTETVLEMIVAGCDMNAVDKLRQSALHKAAMAGAAGVVQVLVDNDADPTLKDNAGATPLLLAASLGNTDIIELLLAKNKGLAAAENDCGWTALHLVSHGREMRRTSALRPEPKFATAVRHLLDAKADVASTDEDKKTPLHRAVSVGNVETLKLLLAAGADVDAEDNCRWRPLHYACEEGHLDVAKELLAGGCVVEEENPLCLTPLAIATQENQPRLAELLMKHKADPNKRSKGVKSPAMIARENREKYADLLSLFELGFIHHAD